jgi:hypothetical protein
MAYDIKKLVARRGIAKRSLTNLENFLNEVDEKNKDLDIICVKQEMLPELLLRFRMNLKLRILKSITKNAQILKIDSLI